MDISKEITKHLAESIPQTDWEKYKADALAAEPRITAALSGWRFHTSHNDWASGRWQSDGVSKAHINQFENALIKVFGSVDDKLSSGKYWWFSAGGVTFYTMKVGNYIMAGVSYGETISDVRSRLTSDKAYRNDMASLRARAAQALADSGFTPAEIGTLGLK